MAHKIRENRRDLATDLPGLMLNSRFVRFWRYLTPKTLWKIIQCTGRQRLPGLAAEMAFNAMLALFPAILSLITAVGLVESSAWMLQRMAFQLSRVVPEEAVFLINGFVREISSSSNQGLFSVSFIVALWAASGGMSATMNALDQIHQISPDHARPFWKAKLISLCLTLGTIVLLMMASFLVFISDLLVALVIVHTPAEVRSQLFTTWLLLRWLLALGIVAIAFGFIYRFGPSRWTSGTPIMPGAMLAAVFWAILSGLFRFYVAQFGNYNRVYGAVGAVIVLLLWLYLTSLVLLLGDQLNFTVGERMRHDRQMRMLKGS